MRAPATVADERAVVLVEGVSDKVALETLARRQGRDLAAEGVFVVAAGGAQAFGRLLESYGPHGLGVRLGGLCDAGEAGELSAALERAGLGANISRAEMEQLGFHVCEADLEEELIRSLGAAAVLEILAAHAKLKAFRTYQKQPAHRARSTEQQLRGFLTNWKIRLAAPLVEALDLGRVPPPLEGVLAHVRV